MELHPTLVQWHKNTILGGISADILLHCLQQYLILRTVRQYLHPGSDDLMIRYTLFNSPHNDYDAPCLVRRFRKTGSPAKTITAVWCRFGRPHRDNNKPNYYDGITSGYLARTHQPVHKSYSIFSNGNTLGCKHLQTMTPKECKEIYDMYVDEINWLTAHETV